MLYRDVFKVCSHQYIPTDFICLCHLSSWSLLSFLAAVYIFLSVPPCSFFNPDCLSFPSRHSLTNSSLPTSSLSSPSPSPTALVDLLLPSLQRPQSPAELLHASVLLFKDAGAEAGGSRAHYGIWRLLISLKCCGWQGACVSWHLCLRFEGVEVLND